MFSGMSSPLDRTRHSKTTPTVAPEHRGALEANLGGRMSYAEILRRFAELLGEQLAREHLAEAKKASGTSHEQND